MIMFILAGPRLIGHNVSLEHDASCAVNLLSHYIRRETVSRRI